jgi:lambda family phage portal protein
MSSIPQQRPGGSVILTQFKAARERERRQQAAQAELQQAMRALHRGPGLRRPIRAATPAPVAEAAFEVVSGQRAFGAAETDRLTGNWVSWNTGINADLERGLATLRARSRDWCVNTDMGRRYLQLVEDNVIGSCAPRLQMRITIGNTTELDTIANQAIEDHWARWGEDLCEVTGQVSWTDVCKTEATGAARDGEFLVRHVRDRALPYGYQVQLLDIDRLPISSQALAGAVGGNVIRLGVEINKAGRPLAYHLYSAHPADGSSTVAPKPVAERVTADQVLHAFVLKRAEQLRGYPWTAQILRRANTLHTYEGYAVEAARIGAAKMGFYKVDKDAAQGGEPLTVEDYRDATGELIQEVEAGMIEALPPGVDFESFDPDYPHENFDQFVTKFERRISAGLGVAHHNLCGDMTGVNYSSARIAELAEREMWRSVQRWFIRRFVRPVFAEWLRMALLKGAITLPNGSALPAEKYERFLAAATFQPRGWTWVDPRADMQASDMALKNNLTSERRIVEERGEDLDEILLERKRYREQLEKLGLPPPGQLPAGAAPGAPGAATPKPADAGDNEEDNDA